MSALCLIGWAIIIIAVIAKWLLHYKNKMYKYKKIRIDQSTTIDEHRLKLKVKGFNNIVHHKDKNPKNNSSNNLEIMSRSKHAKLHRLGSLIRPEPKRVIIDNKLLCYKCKKHVHVSNFSKNKSKYLGYQSNCKDCEKKRKR